MKFFVRRLIKYFLLPFGVIASNLTGGNEHIKILTYHRVNDSVYKEMSVKQDDFLWHMHYLEAKGYSVISLDEVCRMISKSNIRGKYVVLTFDDGYEDFFLHAFPVLQKHNYQATIYIVPNYIESKKTFWWDEGIGESPLMNWDQIVQLSQTNLVTIGSHTMNHVDMNKLDRDELEVELIQSQKAISQRIKMPVEHFSYPRGICTDWSVQLASQIYKTAVLLLNGNEIDKAMESNQLYKLRRIPIQRSDGKLLFIARLKGWLYFDELLRRLKDFLYVKFYDKE